MRTDPVRKTSLGWVSSVNRTDWFIFENGKSFVTLIKFQKHLQPNEKRT